MKKSSMKKICPCYGKKKEFMKIPKCYNCQFKKKCLLEVNKLQVFDVIN